MASEDEFGLLAESVKRTTAEKGRELDRQIKESADFGSDVRAVWRRYPGIPVEAAVTLVLNDRRRVVEEENRTVEDIRRSRAIDEDRWREGHRHLWQPGPIVPQDMWVTPRFVVLCPCGTLEYRELR